MSGLGTIRQRIERATGFFAHREAVVLTTFNLNGQFLEDQALPAILGVEATNASARNTGLHGQLAETACTVYYDPTVAPGVSGKFRFMARPVPLRGRLFHPKLVIIAGVSDDGTIWIYLAVSSANLTLSGWGRNAESFGETWIHTKKQEAWHDLDGFLAWLHNHAKLDGETDRREAVAVVRATLARMPDVYRFRDDDTKPWSGTLNARFYSSVIDEGGLPSFLKMNRSRRPAELRVYSPYWGSVSEMVGEFGAQTTVLVPAMRTDRKAIGLSKCQHGALVGKVEVCRNDTERQDDRFWHMKAYKIRHGARSYTAVGSCNFTEAGLTGANGNVEAMLVFEGIEPEWPEACDLADPNDLSDQPEHEEDVPKPAPITIVVGYDWQSESWRWFLDSDGSQSDFRLSLLPDLAFRIAPGHGEHVGGPPVFPAHFKVTFKQRGELREWQGQIVELHLDHTRRTYGKPLSASDILESWRFHVLAGSTGSRDIAGDSDEDGEDAQDNAPAVFDAVNLYDLYRATRALRTRLAEVKSEPQAQWGLLVTRSDSVMALAQLAASDGGSSVVRYLVLCELSSIVTDFGEGSLDGDPLSRVHEMKHDARRMTLKRLVCDLRGDQSKAKKMLDWFEERLAKMDGPVG